MSTTPTVDPTQQPPPFPPVIQEHAYKPHSGHMSMGPVIGVVGVTIVLGAVVAMHPRELFGGLLHDHLSLPTVMVVVGMYTSPLLLALWAFIEGNDLDKLVTSVAGTKHIIRRRDFPNFCRSNDLSNPIMELIVKEVHALPRAQGLILNTFEELDSLVLPHMRKLCPYIYTIGPLHTLHKTQLIANEAPPSQDNIFSNSVWKEDRTCMSWLDKHDPKTVVYISIGSLATMTIEQLLEIWYGVVNSGNPFLWVRRPGSINGGYDESRIPAELLARTKEIGCIVEWAPQEDVLAHPAIGGFLTHSGWNSTMESIVEGVPMVCWPYFADQHANSRFVGEVWKLGIDMKDTCDRLLVEKAVRDIMESKHDVFTQSANTWLNLARESITKTGSSSIQLGRLIDDIVAMSSTRP